jgi:hypothetical protein
VAGLRAALRDMAGASDSAATLARLHQELDHWRGKESQLRTSHNRSEVERIMLERQVGAWGCHVVLHHVYCQAVLMTMPLAEVTSSSCPLLSCSWLVA